MKFPRLTLLIVSLSTTFVLAAWSGCSAGANNATGTSHGAGPGSSVGGASTGTGLGGIDLSGVGGSTGTSCTGIGCNIHTCSGGGSTTISGTIYDPAGKNPLYGIVAYVPASTPAPFQSGAQCTSCSDLYTGEPVAAAVTDANGHFTIKNAPDGPSIPLVIQVGKWRRQFTLPSVAMCADTPVADGMLTLPKNGGEGDIPQIAISTGGYDTLECLLARVGVDKAEYTSGAGGTGHIHIFVGSGGPDTAAGAPKSPVSLWDSATDIMKYDLVLLSCEGAETTNMNQKVLYNYAQAGGRAFASHFHYSWFNTGPFAMHNLATWYTGSRDIGDINADVVTTWNGMPFTRGQALHDWLASPKVNALTNNQLPIQVARHNADVVPANTASQPWLMVGGSTKQTQDFTFDTPFDVDAGAQCGRIAYSDMHVGAASGDYAGSLPQTTPEGCADVDLSPQEKALEFILFDLSSCVTPNNTPMIPPGQVK